MEEIIALNPLQYQNNIKYAEILYSSAIAQQNSLYLLELSRKYYSHALILIDNETKTNELNNNVPRALWGLLKTCKAIKIN
jgi:hypothetical protein